MNIQLKNRDFTHAFGSLAGSFGRASQAGAQVGGKLWNIAFRLLPLLVVCAFFPLSEAHAQTALTANAGPDQTVDVGDLVTLTGSGTAIGTPTFDWRQESGSLTVTLGFAASPTTETRTFTAPTVTMDMVLTFRLTVRGMETASGPNTSVTDDVEITIAAPGNEVPTALTANAGPDQTVDVGDLVTLTGSGTAIGTPTFDWRQESSSLTVTLGFAASPTTETRTFTAPTVTMDMVLTFRLTVRGMETASGPITSVTDDVEITIAAPGNEVPTANAGVAQTVNERTLVTLNGSGIDPESQPITYLWTQTGTPMVNLSDTTAQSPTFTAPNVAAATTLTFSLTTNDGLNNSAPDTVVITINPIQPLTANAGPDQTVDVGDLVTLTGSGTAIDTPTFDWRQESSSLTVTLGFTAPPTTETRTFTAPTVTTDMVLTFRLTVRGMETVGGPNTSVTDDVVITIAAPGNSPPSANAGTDQSVTVGTTVTLSGAASGDPDESDILTYLWEQVSGTVVTLNNAAAITPTFTAPGGAAANLTFRLTVTDQSGANDSDTVVVIVRVAGNAAPTANAGPNQSVTVGTTVTLSGAASGDLDESDILTYLWEQVSGTVVTLNNAAAITPTFTAPGGAAANLTFRLTVTDQSGASDSNTVVVIVRVAGNAAPTANAGPNQSVTVGTTVTLNGTASGDPDMGDVLTYAWTQTGTPSAAEMVALSSATAASPTFTAPNVAAATTLTFSLTVNDSTADSAPDTVEITVAPPAPLTANAGPDQTVLYGATVTLTGSSSGGAGGTATILWRQTAGAPTVTLTDKDALTATFVAPDQALDAMGMPDMTVDDPVLTLTLMVTIGAESMSDTVTITVSSDSPASAFVSLNDAILPEVAQVISASIGGAIAQRIELPSNKVPSASLNFGGTETLASALQAHGQSMTDGDRTAKELLFGSDFVLPLNGGLGGVFDGMFDEYSPAFWGSGEYRELSGESRRLDWDGEFSGLHLGVDGRVREDLLVGLAVSWVRGDFDYESLGNPTMNLVKGEYDIDMTSVNPYVGWSVGALDLWATVGYGEGDLEIKPAGATRRSRDLTMRTLGVGGGTQIWQRGITDVRLKGEVSKTDLSIESSSQIISQNVDATRVRISLEANQPYKVPDGGTIEPSVEVGVRYDGGDGESGTGIEIGGGLRYNAPVLRLSVEGTVRALLAHSGDYEEWGIQGTLRRTSGADGQGVSFNLSPGYGETDTGLQTLWDQGLTPTEKAEDPTTNYRAYLDARIGYGLPSRHWNAILTPYSELTIGTTDSYRLGLNWKSGTTNLTLSGEHKTSLGTPSHAVLLKGEVRF